MSSMLVDNSQLLVRWTDWSLIKLSMCLCVRRDGRVFSSFLPLLSLALDLLALLFIRLFHFDCEKLL